MPPPSCFTPPDSLPPDPLDGYRLLDDPPVPVPGRPDVYVRILTQSEWESWQELVQAAKGDEGRAAVIFADLVLRTACDARGDRLFSKATPDELATRLNRKALMAVYEAAIAANRLTAEGLEAEKKGSGETTANASGSSSDAPSA